MADTQIRYTFRAVGADSAARSVLAMAAALREAAAAEAALAKARVSAARSTSRTGITGRQFDAHVRARQEEQKRLAREADRQAKAEIRAHERAERAKTTASEREAKRRESIAKREAQQLARAHEKSVRDQRKAHEKAARQAKPKQSLTGLVGDRMTGIAGRFFGMAALAGAGLSLAGGAANYAYDATAAATRQRLINEQKARALAVSGGDRDAYGRLLTGAESTALQVRGTRTEDVLTGQQRYVAMTGDLAGAQRFGKTMATAARATGANEGDIAATMATLSTKFGIQNEAAMQAALSSLIAGGKSGAFEMGDAARYFQEMGAAGTRFGLDKGAGGVEKLGALAQLARMSTGSGAEASTGVQAMLRQLTAKSEDIKRLNKGQEVVFTDKGKTKTRDVVDVITGTLTAAKGNKAELQKIFGDEGMKGASELIKRFNEAGAALGPAASEADRMAAGSKAVRAAFDELSGKAGSWSDVIADAATMTGDLNSKLTTAWEGVVAQVGGSVTPGLAALVEHVDALAAPLIALAKEAGDVTAAFANMIAFLKRYGIIDTAEDKAMTPEQKAERLGQVNKRLGELAKPDDRLTTKEQAEKKALLREQRDLKIETGLVDTDAAIKAAYGNKRLDVYGNADPMGIFGPVKEDSGVGPYQVPGSDKNFDPKTYGAFDRLMGGDVKGAALASTGPGMLLDFIKDVGQNTGGQNAAAEQAQREAASKFDSAASKIAAAAEKLAAGNGSRPSTSLPGT